MPITRVKKADDYTAEHDEEFVAEDLQEPNISGWDSAKQRAAKGARASGGSLFMTITHKPQLFSFIIPAPFDDFDEHWVSSAAGRRPYRCFESNCPLCDIGIAKTSKFAFYVLHFDLDDDEVTPKVLQVGRRVLSQLADIDEDPRQGGPLAGNFFSIKKIGEKQQTQYIISPVRDADLESVWSISSDDARADMKKFANDPPPSLYIPSLDQLKELAEEIGGQ